MGKSRQLLATLVPAAILRPICTWRANRGISRFKRRQSSDVFTEIFQTNFWTSSVSVSGVGSEAATTARIAAALPPLLKKYGVASMLDAPCGDFKWMSNVDLANVDYIGADIVKPLIQSVSRDYAAPRRRFVELDLTHDPLPSADLIFCRDCFIHLPFKMIEKALVNFRKSGAKYLLTTTYQNWPFNYDTILGGVRALDLCRWPFNLPRPTEWIPEEADGQPDPIRGMGLWKMDSI